MVQEKHQRTRKTTNTYTIEKVEYLAKTSDNVLGLAFHLTHTLGGEWRTLRVDLHVQVVLDAQVLDFVARAADDAARLTLVHEQAQLGR